MLTWMLRSLDPGENVALDRHSRQYSQKSDGHGRHKFIDLVWKPRLILEMKSRKENLRDHYQQAFEYWLHSVPRRPKYVILCNFDEFWIYEFDEQMEEPMDRVRLLDLPNCG